MLVLGMRKRTVKWKPAGVSLVLTPLSEERDQALVDETTERVIDDNGRVTDVKRDVPRYVQLVGRECISDWDGVTDEAGNAVDCTPEAIDEFMQIQPAREFVLAKVRGLDLWLRGETDAAKKG